MLSFSNDLPQLIAVLTIRLDTIPCFCLRDYTDRFLRYMLRLLSRRSTLYTEMVTANTIVHCSEAELPRFLAHDGADHAQPVVLQLGGADPDMLRKAMVIARPWGYTSVNLNVGCPSERVAGAGCFGAALMREPDLVGDCCAAMADGADGQVPVTVKCRIGVTSDKARAAEVDDQNDYEALANFIERVSTRGGVRSFTLHARKAVLGGLSPAQNRQIPPLRYHLVRRLAEDFPTLRIALNGGVETLADAAAQLNAPGNRLSGVMVGRAVVARPWEWATVDTTLYGEVADPAPHRRAVFDAYCEFAEQREAEDRHRIRRLLLAPALNLFTGEPHGKKFRRVVDEIAAADRGLSAANILRRAAAETLLDETLDAPPGAKWDHMRKVYVIGEPAGVVAPLAPAAPAAEGEARARRLEP